MEFNAIFLFSLFMLILALRESAAISCYKCGSLLHTDTACEDQFSSSGVSTVSCSGSCTKVKGKKDDVQIVVRDCSTLKLKEQCVDEIRNGDKAHVCACNSDNCNPATTARVSIATTLAVVIGGILYRFI